MSYPFDQVAVSMNAFVIIVVVVVFIASCILANVVVVGLQKWPTVNLPSPLPYLRFPPLLTLSRISHALIIHGPRDSYREWRQIGSVWPPSPPQKNRRTGGGGVEATSIVVCQLSGTLQDEKKERAELAKPH